MIKKISIIGSGNVATHLAKAFKFNGLELDCILSRKKEHADRLALHVGAKGINSFSELSKNSDLYLLCVPDDSIHSISLQLKPYFPKGGIIAHTSGSTPSAIFSGNYTQFGTLYPLQSFSLEREANIREVPFFITASSNQTEQDLALLAGKISDKIYQISDSQRTILHLAAVFSNNFTNYLYQVSAKILESNGLEFDYLRPLILETALKVASRHPRSMQTGPARRADNITMDRHLSMLEDDPELKELYQLLSKGIREEYRVREKE